MFKFPNHDERVFKCFYHSSSSISDSYLPFILFPQNKINLRVLNSRCQFNKGKDIRKPSSERPKAGRRNLIEVVGNLLGLVNGIFY